MKFPKLCNLRLSTIRILRSRNDYLQVNLTKNIVQAGCWSGTLEQFGNRMREVYANGEHRIAYDAAIYIIEQLIEVKK